MTEHPLTLGTAGHIDHGKTALIRALTGIDTDRLPEEQARGISIELGYAHVTLPSGRRLSIIDVPGHERFVRTMVAGATGIDLFLMTVAADDGVMPQTREHALVLEALAVRTGVVAVTKADLADPGIALLETSELLPSAESVAVSARTGQGIDELTSALDRAAARLRGRADEPGPARLHVDRSFTIRGAGTVVTGTLWSGRLAKGDEVDLLPGGRRVRIRGLQVHDQPTVEASAGQRVAVNLVGISVGDVRRGDVLVSRGTDIRASYRIDAQLAFPDREPTHGQRVHVHHGTRETPARLASLGGSFWQLRLERPLVPAAGDHVVIRQIAPQDTLGGGTVLDPQPRKHGPSRPLLQRLERMSRGDANDVDRAQRGVNADGQPEASSSPPPPPASRLSARALDAEQTLRAAGREPPPDSTFDPADLAALRAAGKAVRVSRTLHYHSDVLAEIRESVVRLAERNGGILTLAKLRDEFGTSRKFAQALLEHFDSEKLTLRRGDEHVLRRARTPR